MKKLLLPVFVLALCLCIINCGETDSEAGSVTSIRLWYKGGVIPNNSLTVNLSAGTLTFTADVQITGNASKDFSLASSNPAVAAVSGKTVSLVSGGQTLITAAAASDSGKKHSITLNVNDDNVYSIAVSGGGADMSTALYGQTVTLTPGTQAGMVFSDWTINPPGVVMISPNQFKMPPSDVTVTGNYTGTGTGPYNITNNFAGDSSGGFVAQWHNDSSLAVQTLQFVAAAGSFDNAENITVTGIPFETGGTLGTHALRNIFKTEVTGLSPATLYKYRMGGPGSWSKAFTYMTSEGADAEFSFSVISDPQHAIHDAMITALNLAEAYDEDNRFFIVCGDLVERMDNPSEIISYTNAANTFNIRKPLAAVQGNHDTYKSDTGSEINKGESTVYNAYITFPDNGLTEPNPNKSKAYYFYYNKVLFIMLNTFIDETGDQTPQVNWVKGILEHDRVNKLSKYRIVAMHMGAFGNHYYEDYWIKLSRKNYGKIFADYGVDIVFSGHDHTYSRSNPIKIGSNTAIESIDFNSTPGGTIYTIAGATGPKFYGSIDGYLTGAAPYLEASFPISTKTTLEITPGIFINVKAGQDRLSVTAMRLDGKKMDEYTVLVKK